MSREEKSTVVNSELLTVKNPEIMENVMKSKRFVVRKSLIGKNQIIEVTFKSNKVVKYNHDEVYKIMESKLNAMPCWKKYSSYTSSTNLPLAVRHLEIK
jgi:hypothetical protein